MSIVFLSFVWWSKLRGQANVIIWIHKSIKNPIINYTYRNERIIEVRLNTGRGISSVFGFNAREDGRAGKKGENFYDQLQDIFNKTVGRVAQLV